MNDENLGRCDWCGVVEAIELLDGAPLLPSNVDFNGLGCARCHEEGRIRYEESGEESIKLKWSGHGLEHSVAPELAPYYERARNQGRVF